MTLRTVAIGALALVATLVSTESVAQKARPPQSRPEPAFDNTYRYRLFETTNIWTFILFDTATSRAWQVQYSLDHAPAGRLVINDSTLLPDGVSPKNERFTLYRTHNMYNFLLVDQEDSRIWQIQWSQEAKDRSIVRSIPPT